MNWRSTPPAEGQEATQTRLGEKKEGISLSTVPRQRLVLIWSLLGALCLFALIVFIASLPIYYVQLHTICLSSSCTAGQLTPATLKSLHNIGMSADAYALFRLITALISAPVAFAVAGVLIWRRSEQWMALLVAFMLVMLGVVGITNEVTGIASFWQMPGQLLSAVSFPTYFAVIMAFPDGRFVPRWSRWLVLAFLALSIWYTFFSATIADSFWLTLLVNFLFVGLVGSVPVAQIYRYRYVSTPVARQQTKWVVFGLTVGIILTFVPYLLTLAVPPFNQPGSLYSLFFNPDIGGSPLALLLPLSFGVAILRYQLWDIDLLINRALVYGSLSVLLALVYFGIVVVLQLLLHAVTGQVTSSPLVIVASTLAIAALFVPVRSRIQNIVDRQFYRRKYDAAQTLADFSAALAYEVNLSQLREQLLAVVEETMQPEHVSLWLSEPLSQIHSADSSVPLRTRFPTLAE